MPILYPHHPTFHAISYFLVRIICGPYRRSFPVWDHLLSRIICGPGIICGLRDILREILTESREGAVNHVYLALYPLRVMVKINHVY